MAHILKETVTEFADCSIEDIEKKYIEGKPTESNSPTEGIVTFDIIFDAILPKTDEEIKIIVLNLGKKGRSYTESLALAFYG